MREKRQNQVSQNTGLIPNVKNGEKMKEKAEINAAKPVVAEKVFMGFDQNGRMSYLNCKFK